MSLSIILGCALLLNTQEALHEKLIAAIKSGNEAAAVGLLEQKGIEVNKSDSRGMTPLLQSFLSRNKSLFGKLLQEGADPNVCDNVGRCVMNQACDEQDAFWLRESLSHGGDPNALNPGNMASPGSTPLLYAITQVEIEIETWRAQHVELLIKAGANLDQKNRAGSFPLLVAAKTGNYQLVVKLLEAGAKPDQVDNNGAGLADWFAGRDEARVFNKDQRPWFRQAAELLIKRGLLRKNADGQLDKK